MSRFLTFPAGRRSKWVVFAVWVVAVLGMGAANLPGKFSDAEKNESTSFLPGDAESTKALAVTKQLEGGERAATVIVYRRDGGLTAADKAQIKRDTAQLERAGLPGRVEVRPARALARRHHRADPQLDQGRRQGLDDPRPGGQVPLAGQRPRRRAGGQGDGAGGLQRGRDQGLRGHQRHAAGRRGRARAAAVDPHLPQPVLLVLPAAGGGLRRGGLARLRLPPHRGGRDGQRAVLVDPVGARARRGNRLRAAAGRALSRRAADHRGQARGDGRGAADGGAGDRRLGADGLDRAAGAVAGQGQRHGGPRADRRDGHLGGLALADDVPAGAAGDRRAQAVLALRPPRRRRGHRHDPRRVAPDRRARRRAADARAGRHDGVVGGDGLRPVEPVRRPDAVELVPRRGRVGRRPGAGRRRVPGGRQRADRRDRARPGEGRRGDGGGPTRRRRRVGAADRAERTARHAAGGRAVDGPQLDRGL